MVRTLRRRMAYSLEHDGDDRDAALRSIAHAAARSGARAVDALVDGGVMRVALSQPRPRELPERSARLDRLVEALGVRVRFERGDEVAPPELGRGERARRGLLTAVRFHGARVASRWQGALDDDDPEEVHALRASLRKVKSALWMLGDGGRDPAVRALDDWARALSPLTGALRDLDVALASLSGLKLAAVALSPARARLLAARGLARDAMFAHLRSDEARAGLRSAASAAPRLDEPRGSMGRVASEALEGALHRVERALEGDLHEAEGYHRVRRRARRVRDVIDVGEGALRKGERAWRERLKPVQAQLGELHDADVLTELLAGDEGALDAARAAVAGRRAERLTGLAAPLALLAVDLKER